MRGAPDRQIELLTSCAELMNQGLKDNTSLRPMGTIDEADMMNRRRRPITSSHRTHPWLLYTAVLAGHS